MLKPMFYVNNDSVIAATSIRSGGVSLPPFDTLNLAYHTGDIHDHVKTNRDLFFRSVSINPLEVVYTHQTHSTTLLKVSTKDLGKGRDAFEDGINADALYTTEKNVPLAVFHADCVPVLVYDKNYTIASVIHAGKEGSLQKITYKTIVTLITQEKIDPSSLMVHLGPSLEFAHHPISLEEVDRILAIDKNYSQIIKLISGTFFLDIPLLNYMQLIDAGVLIEHIFISNLDTYSDSHQFFSYQREPKTGRHVSCIMLK
jgi:polyphenol oxidase